MHWNVWLYSRMQCDQPLLSTVSTYFEVKLWPSSHRAGMRSLLLGYANIFRYSSHAKIQTNTNNVPILNAFCNNLKKMLNMFLPFISVWHYNTRMTYTDFKDHSQLIAFLLVLRSRSQTNFHRRHWVHVLVVVNTNLGSWAKGIYMREAI
jgi:hypothetical protein